MNNNAVAKCADAAQPTAGQNISSPRGEQKKALTVNCAVACDTPNRAKNRASTRANSGGYVKTRDRGILKIIVDRPLLRMGNGQSASQVVVEHAIHGVPGSVAPPEIALRWEKS